MRGNEGRMEENDKILKDIVFNVEAMSKNARKECVRMIFGGLGIFLLITILGFVLNFMTYYMIAVQIASPIMSITGVFCWLIALYNSTRAVENVHVTEDGFDVNADHYAFDGLSMNFVQGKCLGKVRKFNSLYLDVRSKGYARKYWMGLYGDEEAYAVRDSLGKLIDHYEFDKKLINKV